MKNVIKSLEKNGLIFDSSDLKMAELVEKTKTNDVFKTVFYNDNDDNFIVTKVFIDKNGLGDFAGSPLFEGEYDDAVEFFDSISVNLKPSNNEMVKAKRVAKPTKKAVTLYKRVKEIAEEHQVFDMFLSEMINFGYNDNYALVQFKLCEK